MGELTLHRTGAIRVECRVMVTHIHRFWVRVTVRVGAVVAVMVTARVSVRSLVVLKAVLSSWAIDGDSCSR